MEKYFDTEKFIDFISNKDKIQTIDISDWLNCSVRLVQKWCKKDNTEYRRIHGIKYYLWNNDTIKKFGEWYNRKLNKPKKIYYIPRPRKENRPDFTTIKNIFDDHIPFLYDNSNDRQERKIKSLTRYIQIWCKINNVPLVIFGGRKYYKISSSVKSRIIKKFRLFNESEIDELRKKFKPAIRRKSPTNNN